MTSLFRIGRVAHASNTSYLESGDRRMMVQVQARHKHNTLSEK
jgi:hypothetical protein